MLILNANLSMEISIVYNLLSIYLEDEQIFIQNKIIEYSLTLNKLTNFILLLLAGLLSVSF